MGPVLRAPPPAEPGTALMVGSALSDAVQRFWEVEEPPQAPRSDPEHEECERFYKNNTSYLRSGRIMTRLPFLAVRPPLGDSRPTAEKRLLAMERRMSRDPLLKEKYIDFMREYEDLGHMSVSKFDWRSMEHFFLPHHAVIKPSSGKLRTVFDGSAQTTSGVSLNQCLHSGPKLLKDLCDVITRFRRHQFVFVADIKMMFRQTVIHPDDRRYQLILWRENPQDPILVYELNTNTYGLRSSPFLAIRSLWELADRERMLFPRAAAILKEDLYVDDICTGASTEREALLLRDELIGILASAGYELRKWISNLPALLDGLPDDHQQDPHLFENRDNPTMMTVLGIQYRPVQDIFTFNVDLDSPRTWTKRLVLSTVARTFDPNGWICPVIFWAKCFLQRLWTAGLGWDKPLREAILKDWLLFASSLPAINMISLPRAMLPPGKHTASLHGFSDASERGYAAAVYLRTVTMDGQVKVSLVMAKSKVAPLRTALTIPKLELSGAALLARLLNHVMSTLCPSVNIATVYAWTDSQIVLCWLKTSVHTLEVFVANRVSQIQKSETPLIWRHVPGEVNPADCASRGCMAPFLVEHSLWWGPEWLTRSESNWPRTPALDTVTLPGLRTLAIERRDHPFDPDFLMNRYSSLDKLLGVTAWIKRFTRNCRHPQNKCLEAFLSPQELQDALLHWVRSVQEENFENEIDILRKGKCKLSGAICKLNPLLDSAGLLRVGGRLRNANLPYGARHPLLLPKSGHLTEIASRLASRRITWKFSPASCPHWGGIFESVVKVAKTHLRRVIGESVLTFEELATVFCKIEAMLNSRPLCPISSDPNDLEALTPGHFLIGRPLNALPEYPYVDVKLNRLSRFELIQQLTQSFWKRWNLEYLHILQQRVKWTDKTDPPHVGDLVLVKDANSPPLCWRRGRILNLVFGADGVPRFAEVRVDGSVLKRAVSTLSRLPID
ncbi:uncharacterized protein LOC123658650 [Melitaea cinxia]|uniref:uncharacterized protein LOC123658650 n=1 Tax=Melitaea cinxia TaxID=113334 RepID=UPI001E27268B|nr:uncharacterized protein LOC123658650 [Melitaea cinxia]